MPYSKCIENRAWQDKVLSNAMKLGGFIAITAVACGSFKAASNANFGLSFDALISKLKF